MFQQKKSCSPWFTQSWCHRNQVLNSNRYWPLDGHFLNMQLTGASITTSTWQFLKQRCALAAGKQSTSCSGQPKKVSALNEVHISTFSLYDNLELSLWCWSDCRSRRWQELIEKESWEENPLLLLQNKFKSVLRMMNKCHCNHVTM